MGKSPTEPASFGEIEPTKPPGEKFPKSPPDREAFESYMEEGPAATAPSGKAISPMELGPQASGVPPTPENLLEQVDNTNNKIDFIKQNLQTPNLALKNSHQRLLDSKISQSFYHAQKAAEHLGATKIPEPKTPETSTPVAKFLGYLSGGQEQLLEAKKKLQQIQASGKQLTPSQMLLVQVNLAQAQQQIEFSSVLLSKVVDALKQTINIQL
jgi:hypothetical protein